jgi:general secretion pathway protein L
MSLLLILLPPRPRLSTRAAPADADALRLPAELDFVYTGEGRAAAQQGRAAAALLPRADSTALVVADADIAWHALELPRANSARMRAALGGALEEALLDEDEATHLALGPGAQAGQRGWVAAMHRPWLTAWLAALETAGRPVDRVLPMSRPLAAEPAGAVWGHFHDADDESDAQPWLTIASADGVRCANLSGAYARTLVPAPGTPVTWTATPAAAALAERFVGARVAVRTDAERALAAAADGFNLRQFDLAPRHRGTRAVAEFGRRLMSPPWRAARWGAAALVAVQLIGLNAYAWQQREAIAQRKQAMAELLKATHPGVRAVLDAPVQMQRETERLRAAAGRTGDADLETLLAAAAGAWPDGQGPVQTLRFEAGRLTLAASGWAEPQVQQFQQRLLAAGYRADFSEGRFTVMRADRGAG